MADGRVGQGPLHVGLDDAEDRAAHHRQDGQGVDDRLPVGGVLAEGQVEDPDEAGEGGRLHARGHERGDRRGRAVVDVGAPRVERHRRHLEAEADEQHGEADQQQRVVQGDRLGEQVLDLDQVGGPGGAVDHGDAVEEERRREAAEDEVLEAGLLGLRPLPVEGGQGVDGDRQRLEGQEQHQQVVGHGHEHAARGRQEHEDVQLGPVEALAPQVVVGEERAEDHRRADHEDDEHPEAVDADGAPGGGEGAVGRIDAEPADLGPALDLAPERDGGGHGGAGDDHGVDGVDALEGLAPQQRRERQQQDGAEGQHDDGPQRRPVDGRGDDAGGLGHDGAHHSPPPLVDEPSPAPDFDASSLPSTGSRSRPRSDSPGFQPGTFSSTWWTSCCTEGSMRSSTGFG